MSLRQLLRETFSTYEIAIMGRAIAYALGLSAMAAWFPHPTRVTGLAFGIGMILFLSTLAAALVSNELSRCPTCSKSPFRRAKGEVGFFLEMMGARRFWPERECSECGTALDIKP